MLWLLSVIGYVVYILLLDLELQLTVIGYCYIRQFGAAQARYGLFHELVSALTGTRLTRLQI